ncbi:YALIA101S02e03598g1_1 [Yarrowia lipolytica]|nr:YALIA101S02e03598g1_1 [Yarrowia lipolytica]
MLPTRSLRSMKGRLAALAENARPSKEDPHAGKIFDENGEEVVQALNFNQVKEQNKRDEDEFHKKYPRHIAYSKMPSYASKQDRLNTETVPWTGEEGFEQGVLRMLEDAHKPLGGQAVRSGQGVPLPKRAPKVSVSARLSGARDQSLDYTMDKVTGTKPVKDEEMSATRRRALDSMGTLNGPVILSGIQSIADQRIEDARKRGQFDGIKRGVPLDLKHSSNPMIDDTEYFLNSMLKRQNILPPWIERQTKLGVKTDRLISDMRVSFIRHVVHSVVRKSKRLEDVLGSLDKHSYENGDPSWEQNALKYHETALEGLNSSIRSYNLQAPQPARRGYLSFEDILKCVYSDVDKAIRQEVIREMTAEKKKPPQLYERKVIREKELPKWRVKDMWGHLFG